ncbi:MAG: hypothetical protein Q8R26_04080 [bacterium]|nr:hypothetical protein [bacterium]
MANIAEKRLQGLPESANFSKPNNSLIKKKGRVFYSGPDPTETPPFGFLK